MSHGAAYTAAVCLIAVSIAWWRAVLYLRSVKPAAERGRHSTTGPSWDRATHPYTVLRDEP